MEEIIEEMHPKEIEAKESITAEKTFSQTDMDEALKNARALWEKEQSEAIRLSKLSQTQREKEENRLEREALQKERTAFEREKLEMEAAKQLKALGVPESFAGKVCGQTAEETRLNIDAFAEEWNLAVMTEVNEKLKGRPPKGNGELNGADSMRSVIRDSVRRGF